MEKESLSEEFDRILKEKSTSNFPSRNPLQEASYRFGEIYEQKLVDAAQAILKSDSVSPIVEIIEMSVCSIAKGKHYEKSMSDGESKFGPWDKYEIRWWKGGGTSVFERKILFDVKYLGKFGDCHTYPGPSKEKEEFMEAVENGSQITDLIDGFQIEYRILDILLAVKVIKDDMGNLSIINWRIGGSDGTLQIQNLDFHPLIEIFASRVAEGDYVQHLYGAPGWADPGYGGGLS